MNPVATGSGLDSFGTATKKTVVSSMDELARLDVVSGRACARSCSGETSGGDEIKRERKGDGSQRGGMDQGASQTSLDGRTWSAGGRKLPGGRASLVVDLRACLDSGEDACAPLGL